jgi:hypothetical protein
MSHSFAWSLKIADALLYCKDEHFFKNNISLRDLQKVGNF